MGGYILRVPVTTSRVSGALLDALSVADGPQSIIDLHRATAAHPNAIQLRLKRWEREGIVCATPTVPRLFTMTDNVAAVPSGVPSRAPTMRQRLWTAMRVLKRFDLPTIIIAAESTRRSAEDFINVLLRTGYIARQTRGNPMTGEWSVYALKRRSGPTAPIVTQPMLGCGRRGRVLFDPNDGTRHDIRPDLTAAASARGINHVC